MSPEGGRRLIGRAYRLTALDRVFKKRLTHPGFSLQAQFSSHPMSASLPGNRDLPSSQYDLTTYWGRVRHAADISDPRYVRAIRIDPANCG